MSDNVLTDNTLQQNMTPTPIAIWVPSRPVATPLSGLNVQSTIASLQSNVAKVTKSIGSLQLTSAPASSATDVTPGICTNVAAVESPYKTDSGMKSLVSVSFDNTDPNFATADIYLTGYHGSTSAQFATSGTASAISFLCDITGETITVTVVAVGADGSSLPIDQAPSTTVKLDGVQSAPPPPSIVANSFTLTALGYSFSFDVEGGLLQDIIANYNVYRNTTNTFTGAVMIQSIPQPTNNQGTIQVQDVQPQNNTTDYFYWVTAVNTSGLESTPESAGNAAEGGIPAQVSAVSAVESPYKTPTGQMVSVVSVDFTPVANDPYFAGVQVYFNGYNGNPLPQLMAEGSVGPIEFLCETTGETVVVTVVAVSASGAQAPIASAPTCLVSLDGQASAPPAPSIAQAQVAMGSALGWQFAFNVIGGLELDLIDSYRIYHGEESDGSDMRYFTTFKQPPTNTGSITVQEITSDILCYWVSAVSTSGLESVLVQVPFTYVDPNATAPTAPAPVSTTNSYKPTLVLNGWAKGAHVGWWESQDAGGINFGLSSSQVAGPYTNPSSVYDGNQTTSAGYSGTHHAGYAGCVWGFSTFSALPSGTSITSATLSVISDVLATAGNVMGEASVWYSLDAGNTWNQVYLWDSHTYGTLGPRSKRTDTVNIQVGQDFTKIQVMVCSHSHDDLAHNVYEISLSITQSAPAGPQPVTGVTASLDTATNSIKVSWNGLTPTNRADIISYEVTRGVAGSTYADSHTQTTIPFVSGQATYSWEDPQAHDASFVYWVIANNSTGWSAPSAPPAGVTGAASLVYSNGKTVEALRPAAVGADVTSQNTAKDTAAVNGRAATDVSGTIVNGGGIDLSSSLHKNMYLVRNNLMDASWWAQGASLQWALNEQTGVSDAIVPSIMPDGSSRNVWQATSGAQGNQGGGWNPGGVGNSFTPDPTKTYMFVCYFRRVSGNGGVWWGIQDGSVADLNTTSNHGNPYFQGGVQLPDAGWYMIIGWVYPYGSTGMTNGLAGVWSCATGKQIQGGSSYCWNSNPGAIGTRAYQFYASQANSIIQFASPMVCICDGHEPSLQSLLSFAAVSGANPITGSNYSSMINPGAIPVDHLGDGTNYLRVPRSIYGSSGNAIDQNGNLKLKNMNGVGGVTASPTVAASFADLPELGSGNAAMTMTLKGNPCLVGANLNFNAMSSGGNVGGVTSIGWAPSGFTIAANFDHSPVNPPSISISITGNGTGAGASVSWSLQGNGGPPTAYTYTPTLGISPGSGYTSATATVTISNAPSGSGYSNGTFTYGCTILMSTPKVGVPVEIQILMDGVVALGPFATSTDSNGNAVFNLLQLLFPTAGSHSFRVQAEQLGSGATVTSGSRAFQLVELG